MIELNDYTYSNVIDAIYRAFEGDNIFEVKSYTLKDITDREDKTAPLYYFYTNNVILSIQSTQSPVNRTQITIGGIYYGLVNKFMDTQIIATLTKGLYNLSNADERIRADLSGDILISRTDLNEVIANATGWEAVITILSPATNRC